MARSGDLQEELKRLKEELHEARLALIEIMGDEAQEVLSSYRTAMEPVSEGYEGTPGARATLWLRGIVGEVLRLAEVKPTYTTDRAICPLCRGSAQGPYANGFSFPVGLERHLLGGYNAHQCRVMQAARELARDYAETRDRLF